METRDPHTSAQTRAHVDPDWQPGMITVGATEDNLSAVISQICTKAQESRDNITEGKDWWLISIENYVDDTTKKPQIGRVPRLMHGIESNIKCYDPLVVSIGPYHHGNPDLKEFEERKIPIAQEFCRACGNKVSIKDLYEEVAKEGKNARECYEEGSTKCYDDEVFNRMMFLDACFVLYFMFILRGGNVSSGTEKEQKRVYPLQHGSCYLAFVHADLCLLENQIPLLVLNVLMKFRIKKKSERTEFIQNFINRKITKMPPQKNTCTKAFQKLYARMMGRYDQEKNERKLDLKASPHLLHLVREQLIGPPPDKKKKKKSVGWYSYRSVTELKSEGIHFRPSQTHHITDVKFKHHHLFFGTLTLPPISVDDGTKALLLNLVAYEMSPHGLPSDYRSITSYICLMDSLIDNANDVKELRKKRILVNNLGSDEELAKLFNEIAIDLVPDPHAYADTKQQIEDHCQNKGLVWMSEWLHDHFSSPWTILAFIGAIFALVLTMIQTYFAIFPR